jgi:hypothetical protein
VRNCERVFTRAYETFTRNYRCVSGADDFLYDVRAASRAVTGAFRRRNPAVVIGLFTSSASTACMALPQPTPYACKQSLISARTADADGYVSSWSDGSARSPSNR